MVKIQNWWLVQIGNLNVMHLLIYRLSPGWSDIKNIIEMIALGHLSISFLQCIALFAMHSAVIAIANLSVYPSHTHCVKMTKTRTGLYQQMVQRLVFCKLHPGINTRVHQVMVSNEIWSGKNWFSAFMWAFVQNSGRYDQLLLITSRKSHTAFQWWRLQVSAAMRVWRVTLQVCGSSALFVMTMICVRHVMIAAPRHPVTLLTIQCNASWLVQT